MSGIQRLNRELARLDVAMRSGQLAHEQFRAQRRRLLHDFEERHSTTAPGVVSGDITAVDPPASADITMPTREQQIAVPPREPEAPSAPGGQSAARWLMMLGPALVLAIGLAWWLLRPTPIATPAASAAIPAAAPAVGNDMPQNVAGDLMQTEWSAADLDTFLQRWQRLSPEAVRASTEDPRIWLLRGETDRRLRTAREAQSVDASEEAGLRVQQLERVQGAIRAP